MNWDRWHADSFFGEKVARIWEKVSGAQRAYQLELIYMNQLEIKRQLDKLDDRVEWLCRYYARRKPEAEVSGYSQEYIMEKFIGAGGEEE